MTFKTILPWLQRGLAVVGLAAIIAFVGQNLFNVFSVATTSSLGGYAEFASKSLQYDTTVGDSLTSFDFEEQSLSAPSPEGFLYDEAIAAEVDQKIIKTGSLDLVVDHADESLTTVETLAEGKGGYVQTSTIQEHEDGTLSGYVTIRVPAEQFDTTIEELKGLAIVVERETTSAEDVTEQYIDLAARLKNAQAQETRYVEILDVAKTVEEILQIEAALGNIRGYIESLQGQLNYLDSLTGFSTITISLSEEPVITVGGKEFRPGTTVKEAAQAVVAIAQALVAAIIWIVIVGIGIGVPLALIVWLGWKGITRLRKR
ncbi:MAG TPA: DUF4349 domain-containing protein [Patescibacteria group bacterium]|nr:DUF4349 domain-containing protein [Patescibacteria group bacterium]